MQLRILFATTFSEEANLLKNLIKADGLVPIECHSGKELLKQVIDKGAFAVVINIDTRNDFSLEVIKQINLYNQHIRIILTFKDNNRYLFYKRAIKNYSLLGIADYFIFPYEPHKMMTSIKGQTINSDMINKTKHTHTGKKVELEKNSLFEIKLQNLLSGNLSPFTIYEETENGDFFPFLFRGSSINPQRFLKYNQNQAHRFYSTESDRQDYINLIQSWIQKVEILNLQRSNYDANYFFDVDFYAEKYISQGIKRETSLKISNIISTILKTIQTDEQLSHDLDSYISLSNKNLDHVMNVTFIALSTCLHFKSCKDRQTLENLGIASILHEIGLSKLPNNLKTLRPYEVNQSQFKSYNEHINYTIAKLTHSPLISEQIRKIIYQQNEYCDGTGHPCKLESGQIYTPSKILSLANYYADFIEENSYGIFEGLEKFLFNDLITKKFSPLVMTSFIKGLYRPKLEERQQGFL